MLVSYLWIFGVKSKMIFFACLSSTTKKSSKQGQSKPEEGKKTREKALTIEGWKNDSIISSAIIKEMKKEAQKDNITHATIGPVETVCVS